MSPPIKNELGSVFLDGSPSTNCYSFCRCITVLEQILPHNCKRVHWYSYIPSKKSGLHGCVCLPVRLIGCIFWIWYMFIRTLYPGRQRQTQPDLIYSGACFIRMVFSLRAQTFLPTRRVTLPHSHPANGVGAVAPLGWHQAKLFHLLTFWNWRKSYLRATNATTVRMEKKTWELGFWTEAVDFIPEHILHCVSSNEVHGAWCIHHVCATSPRQRVCHRESEREEMEWKSWWFGQIFSCSGCTSLTNHLDMARDPSGIESWHRTPCPKLANSNCDFATTSHHDKWHIYVCNGAALDKQESVKKKMVWWPWWYMCTYGFHGIVPKMSFVDHIFDLNMTWACRTLGQHTTTIHIPRTNTHAHIFSCHVHLWSGLRHDMSSHYSYFLPFHIPTTPYWTSSRGTQEIACLIGTPAGPCECTKLLKTTVHWRAPFRFFLPLLL